MTFANLFRTGLLAAALAVVSTGTLSAHEHRYCKHVKKHYKHSRYAPAYGYRRPVVVYQQAPVYYAPPAPVYYEPPPPPPPPPVYYGPRPRVSIGVVIGR